jgi:site-specific DNA-cytosine methylase
MVDFNPPIIPATTTTSSTITHASACTGIGGFDLAAEQLGWKNIFQVEKDAYCQKILQQRFPETEKYGDIYEFDARPYRGLVDVFSAGFPCQPFSCAGPKLGILDPRELSGQCLRIVDELRPVAGVFENVRNFIGPKFSGVHDQLCSALEALGYETGTFDIESDCFGAPTMERHVWIVFASRSQRLQRHSARSLSNQSDLPQQLQRTDKGIRHGRDISETKFHSVGERLSRRLGKGGAAQLKAYGNAVPPEVVRHIFRALESAITQQQK